MAYDHVGEPTEVRAPVRSEVYDALDRNQSQLDRLSKHFDQLRERLDQLVRPPLPSRGGDDLTVMEEPVGSALALRILAQSHLTQGLCVHLEGLLERLDLP